MAIYDAMQYVKPDTNAKIMIHQGSAGFRGTRADIQIAAREILELTRQMAEIVAHHSSQDVEQIMRHIDRDRFMTPQEAAEYGGIMEQRGAPAEQAA